MVAPFAIDLQIAQRPPFFAKTQLAQQISRGLVLRDARRLDAVQRKGAKSERQQSPQRSEHAALPRIGLADPIADGGTLRHTAAHIGNGTATKQNLVARAENQERISQIIADFARVPAQSPPERGARKLIRYPGGLPWRQKIPALPPQLRPLAVIASLRIAQKQAISFQHRFAAAGK